MLPKCKTLLLLMMLSLLLAGQGFIEPAPCSKVYVAKVIVLLDDAGQHRNLPLSVSSLSWHPDGKTLLVDFKGVNGYYRVAQLFPMGGGASRLKYLTDMRVPGDTRFHNGNPRWLPNGEGFLFSGQNHDMNELASSEPGYGFGCHIYFGDKAGKSFVNLTDMRLAKRELVGYAMPIAAPDANMLFWTECRKDRLTSSSWGRRRISQASFKMENGSPKLENVRDITPDALRKAFVETSDCKAGQLLYSASADESQWYGMDVFAQKVSGKGKNEPRNLTNDATALDRFPVFSPNAKKLAWSSTREFDTSYFGVDSSRWQSELRSELWIMEADGRDRQRITYFNQKGHEHYMSPNGAYVYMVAWHPKFDNFIALVLRKPEQDHVSSSVLLLELGIRK
ncbi:MAG: PD40 domain-containing protein [Victivallales bacterium]|nr:PD40 domain-containing protein [Victivallales bacterium]